MAEFLRQPGRRYEDPLARVWIACAERLGFKVERTRDAYASTDGRGTILIAVDEMFDPDDSLAQMIFHELCHALVEGEEAEARVDWGLGLLAGGGYPWREHACLRLQAYLAGRVGLRNFFAPTTDYRVSFWDSLPDDPFYAPPESGGRRERSCVAARIGAWRASLPRWEPHLKQALASSAAIASATPRFIRTETLSESKPRVPALDESPEIDSMPSLWATVAEAPPEHPAGNSHVAAHFTGRGCSDCAWGFVERRALRCRHAPRVGLPGEAPACWRYEPADELDCLNCGACCREAYHSVEISNREAVNKRHPELVVIKDTHRKLRRINGRCAGLSGGNSPNEAYACAIYEYRPRTCREFTRGSTNCLDARRRVGLSL